MSQRFLVYPILFILITQLIPLLGGDWKWYVAQISQLSVTILACCGAIYFSNDFVWVPISWSLFVAFVVAPALLTFLAAEKEQRGYWRGAALFRQWAGRLTWGQTGRLYRRYAAALYCVARGQTEEALTALNKLAVLPMPLVNCGGVLIWELSLLVTLRQWERAVAYYESIYDWGTLGQAVHARLIAARAWAEVGQIDRALRSLQFVALSPRTLGARQAQLWATRVCVAALAGDTAAIESLLRQRGSHGLRRFAAYWRGRCALARGDREGAVQQLTRALALTRTKDRLWRDAITQQLHRAQTEELPTHWAAQEPGYAHGQDLLDRAEKETVVWRALMHMGRPEVVTLALLVAMAAVYLYGDVFWRGDLQQKFVQWGNSFATVEDGEWWRIFTALFLHANWLHLAMNGAGLWIFGTAVEKTMGRWRFFAVFMLSGALANLASAFALHYDLAHYDVAIGASGGIFGVIGAFAVAVWRLRSPLYHTLRRRLLVVLALMVATDLTIGGLEPQVDNLAHVGGLVAGILIALVLYPRRERAAPSPVTT